uniref:Biotin carboxyl carrier protein of acetyl-CoA carboxylase n=1 Tax=Asparagopsis taxiformis TaxID=260499 RepID=A0A1C9CBZ0_9FLOR|nr:acetyl-CoA carboxylase biotin carboxyl carrier protein [Asparagopsis taxiformis]AOM65887.1 acetyl-CoA carboxylase biotin carboxyl carrier protein [Asparagopsis taxiformis]
MQFNLKDLKKLLSTVKLSNIDLIQIKSNQLQLTINKTITKSPIYSTPTKSIINQKHIKPREIINHEHKTNTNTIQLQKHETEIYSTIVSPMVGTFYRSPGPNESPFVQQYDCVDKKQTVCIIEAMKLMNEIEAEVNGEIIEILVNDGDIVDCGQALMKVKPI